MTGDPLEGQDRGRVSRALRSPTLAILLVAPFFGEALSGSTPPLDLVLPWNLALMAALYGSGALLCREVARRFRLGLLGLILLGAAYGVYEEALVDGYWFSPQFWDDVDVGTYSQVWHTNLLLAVHLTVFHSAVSICSSILIVERLFPDRQARPWAGRWGLGVAAVALFVVVPILYGDAYRPGYPVLGAAAVLLALLVVAAFVAPRLTRPTGPRPEHRRRGLAYLAFVCTAAHFVLVYALPSSGIPWPWGIVLALVPVALAVVLVPRLAVGGPYGSDSLRVVSGILTFFILLDAVVGLAGRYDLTGGAIAMTLFLWWLHRQDRVAAVLANG